jgi:hypothetical protein
MRFDTYKASYDNLHHMLCMILERNLRSYFDVLHFPNPMGGPSILQRLNFLDDCVRAF